MKLTHLTMAAALALGIPSISEAANIADISATTISNSWVGPQTVNLTAGVLYTLGINWTSISGNYSVSNFGALVYQGADFIYNVSNIGSTNGGGAGASTTFSVTSSGVYDLWLAAYAAPSGGPVPTSSYTVNNLSGYVAVAVPGPEAGAGIGALAMGGLALYLKRRRKDEMLAA